MPGYECWMLYSWWILNASWGDCFSGSVIDRSTCNLLYCHLIQKPHNQSWSRIQTIKNQQKTVDHDHFLKLSAQWYCTHPQRMSAFYTNTVVHTQEASSSCLFSAPDQYNSVLITTHILVRCCQGQQTPIRNQNAYRMVRDQVKVKMHPPKSNLDTF